MIGSPLTSEDRQLYVMLPLVVVPRLRKLRPVQGEDLTRNGCVMVEFRAH